jgi:hypothetical protein
MSSAIAAPDRGRIFYEGEDFNRDGRPFSPNRHFLAFRSWDSHTCDSTIALRAERYEVAAIGTLRFFLKIPAEVKVINSPTGKGSRNVSAEL